MTFSKKSDLCPVLIFLMIFFLPIIAPISILAAEPISIGQAPLAGEYIGRNLDYLNHQEVIDSLIKDLKLNSRFKEKIRTGHLVSDNTIRISISWTDTGYRASFSRIGEKDHIEQFEVGIHDLEKSGIAAKFKSSDDRILIPPARPRPYWLRFKVANNSPRPVNFILELDKYLFDYINLYFPTRDGYRLKRQTFNTPMDRREVKTRHFVFRLTAEPGDNTYYMFTSSWIKYTRDSIPLRIWSMDKFIRHSSDDGTINGILVGLFLFIFLYNLFIFCSVGDPSYLLLSLVTLCQLILEITVSGVGFQYAWPEKPLWSLQILSQNTALVMGFNLLFYRSFIGIHRYTPRLDRGLLYLSWFFFACAVSFFVIPRFLSEIMLAFLFTVDHLYTLPVLIPTVIAIRNKNRSAVFVLIGIVFYYLGLLKFGLTGSDIIPYDIFKYLPIKGLSFLIIMTLGLSHKFHSMRKSLVDLNINLERRVIERTEKLQQANEKLKELDSMKNRLFANISHEFRTPLTLILDPIRLLLQGEYGKLTKKSQAVICTMKRNADRLLKLINDYLDLSKIEAGRMAVNKRSYNVSELLSICLSSFDSSAAGKGIEMSFQDRTNGLVAWIDPELMEKAVFNLLSNAIKFNRPEGKSRIDITLENGPDQFAITVKDSGIGIPQEQLEEIFDRFRQVDSPISRQHEGTGIGLSLAMEIVGLHDGEILVESEPGKGTQFTVNIPMVEPGESSAGEPDSSRPVQVPVDPVSAAAPIRLTRDVASDDLKILVAEDNDDMRHYLKGILGKHYQTVTAANGKEALKILERERIDLVLSDLIMPEIDGYELTQAIRSRTRFEGLPIILLTARSDVPDRIQGFEKGANDYIIKPFSAEEVLARIGSQLTFKLLRDKLYRANLNLKGKRKILTDVSMIRIEAVKDFLNENYAEDFTREDLATMARMSPDHLGKMFKQATGMKISDYVNRKRVTEASRQLRETRSKIVDVAFDVGFTSLRSFNQVFREITGDSPSGYRKKQA